MADEYDEVRLVFDRYINSSLKEKMRRKRTKGKSTYYHVKDTTLIQNIFQKDLISNIKTKAELTAYLAAKTTDHSKGPTNKLKKFIVTSGTETKGNTCVPSTLVTHSQEEADTLLLLHELSIDRHAEVVIASPDTDVLLLMIQMYPSLPCDISFLTGKSNLRRNIPFQPVYMDTDVLMRYLASMLKQDRTCLDGLQGDPKNGAAKCLWHVTMTYLMLWNR